MASPGGRTVASWPRQRLRSGAGALAPALTCIFCWWRGRDLNPRPSGYEPDELRLLHPASFGETHLIGRPATRAPARVDHGRPTPGTSRAPLSTWSWSSTRRHLVAGQEARSLAPPGRGPGSGAPGTCRGRCPPAQRRPVEQLVGPGEQACGFVGRGAALLELVSAAASTPLLALRPRAFLRRHARRTAPPGPPAACPR